MRRGGLVYMEIVPEVRKKCYGCVRVRTLSEKIFSGSSVGFANFAIEKRCARSHMLCITWPSRGPGPDSSRATHPSQTSHWTPARPPRTHFATAAFFGTVTFFRPTRPRHTFALAHHTFFRPSQDPHLNIPQQQINFAPTTNSKNTFRPAKIRNTPNPKDIKTLYGELFALYPNM